jgi:hypothetical protein
MYGFDARRHGLWLVVGALLLWGWRADRAHARRLDTAAAALAAQRDSAARWAEDADQALRAAASWELAAEQAERRATTLAAGAQRAQRRAQQAELALEALTAAAPDTCRPLADAAAAALAAEQAVSAEWEAAFGAERQRATFLAAALDTTQIALTEAQRRVVALSDAAGTALDAARVPWYKKLVPTPGVGVAFGVDADLRPRAVAGLTLGWRF